jgi:polysaccharide biosynthesis transport protein
MNVHDHRHQLPAEHTAWQNQRPAIQVSNAFWALRKGWLFPAIGCLVSFVVAFAYLITKPTLYQSSSRLLIDQSMSQYLQSNRIVGQPGFGEIGSQIYVLKSDSVILPVVQALNLADDPEFAGPPEVPSQQDGWNISKIKNIARTAIGWLPEDKFKIETPRERIAAKTLLERLSVYREDMPNVINVTVESQDPRKASVIANTIVETYLSTVRNAKYRSTRVATGFLRERLKELKDQALKAEQALQNYKNSKNLTATKNDSRSSEQLSNLRSQLIQARIAMAEAKARIRDAEEAAKSGVFGILGNNEVVTKLRVEVLDLASQVRDLETRVGPSHRSVRKLRTRMAELRGAMRGEGSRIARKYMNDFQAFKQRADELQTAIAMTAQKVELKNKSRTKLRELEATAKTLSNLYNNALEKLSQLSGSTWSEDARIISRATPSPKKRGRKFWAILAGGTLLGFFAGAAFPVGRELIAAPYRTPSQIRNDLGVYCATLPALDKHSARGFSWLRNAPVKLIEEQVIDAPHSRFSNAVRNVEAAIISANARDNCKVICVASCLPGEGKTTLIANLAASLAREATGSSVLVIDCDLHKRSVTERLTPNAEKGLLEALESPSDLSSLVVTQEKSNVDVLPCVASETVNDRAKRLGSDAMRELLNTARKSYDFILIEAPPVLSVVDMKMIERFIDGFILVIEWGATGHRLVDETITEIDSIQERLICAALNKVNAKALKEMETYKGSRFGEYYIG